MKLLPLRFEVGQALFCHLHLSFGMALNMPYMRSSSLSMQHWFYCWASPCFTTQWDQRLSFDIQKNLYTRSGWSAVHWFWPSLLEAYCCLQRYAGPAFLREPCGWWQHQYSGSLSLQLLFGSTSILKTMLRNLARLASRVKVLPCSLNCATKRSVGRALHQLWRGRQFVSCHKSASTVSRVPGCS